LSSAASEKEDMMMTPQPSADSSFGALAPIILKWPWSVQRGERAPPIDFDGAGNGWSPTQHLLLTAGEPTSC
jgi:hypothetical protein